MQVHYYKEYVYDVSAHSSLSKLVIIVLGLLERTRMMMDNFPWATNMHFSIFEVLQAYSSSFKGANADTTL